MKDQLLYAYLAGFFDGDGNVFRNPSTGRWYLNVTNTQCSILEIFKDTFGGSIHPHRKAGENASNHVVSRKNIYRWYCSGKVGIKVASVMFPHLTLKKTEMGKALEENFGLVR